MIKTERTNSYRFTAPLYQGEITNPVDIELYKLCLEEARERTKDKSPRWRNYETKFVVRKRYRGPRNGRRNGQSMCLKRDATRCDVYLYEEIIRRG